MNKNEQFIICVESNEKAKTDRYYVKSILDVYYYIGTNKLSFIYMAGKFNYQNQRVLNEIETLKKSYRGTSHVIFVLDKDKNSVDQTDANFVTHVKTYCHTNHYHLVWFVRTIEEVAIGKKINKKLKNDMAQKFGTVKQIKQININCLQADHNVNQKGNSNILTIFNQFKSIKKK